MDRKQFWRKKYIKERWYDFVINIILSVVLILVLRKRVIILESVRECVIAFLLLAVVCFIYFLRRMDQYVRLKLAEEENPKKHHFDEDDPRMEDAESEDEDGEIQE